jgi:putative oxidoreductase
MKNILKTSKIPTLLCRVAVGLIFFSEGLQKFVLPEVIGTGRFAKIGFPSPAFWAYLTASFEIVCGILIIIGLVTRLACIPLLIIMITAFVTTKIPLFMDKGLWVFLHEGRVDFALTLLLVFLLIYGGGRMSVDIKIYRSGIRSWRY